MVKRLYLMFDVLRIKYDSAKVDTLLASVLNKRLDEALASLINELRCAGDFEHGCGDKIPLSILLECHVAPYNVYLVIGRFSVYVNAASSRELPVVVLLKLGRAVLDLNFE